MAVRDDVVVTMVMVVTMVTVAGEISDERRDATSHVLVASQESGRWTPSVSALEHVHYASPLKHLYPIMSLHL